jgi:hypothetical protein
MMMRQGAILIAALAMTSSAGLGSEIDLCDLVNQAAQLCGITTPEPCEPCPAAGPPPITDGMLPTIYGTPAWKTERGAIVDGVDQQIDLPADIGYLAVEFQFLPEALPPAPAQIMDLGAGKHGEDRLLGILDYEGDRRYTGAGSSETQLTAPPWSAGSWIHVRRLVDFEYGCAGWWLEPTTDRVSVAQLDRWSRELIGPDGPPDLVLLLLSPGQYADVTVRTAPRGLSRHLTAEAGWTIDLCGSGGQ